MSKATFGKPRPDQPFKNNGGTIILGINNGVVTQTFGADLLAATESSSLDEINAVYTAVTRNKIIDYYTGKYVDDLSVVKDSFLKNGGRAFSSAFSNDFGG